MLLRAALSLLSQLLLVAEARFVPDWLVEPR